VDRGSPQMGEGCLCRIASATSRITTSTTTDFVLPGTSNPFPSSLFQSLLSEARGRQAHPPAPPGGESKDVSPLPD
jgi:hypothetical protein